jgi:hypothetical protein
MKIEFSRDILTLEMPVFTWIDSNRDTIINALNKSLREKYIYYGFMEDGPPMNCLPQYRVLSEMPLCYGLKKLAPPDGFSCKRVKVDIALEGGETKRCDTHFIYHDGFTAVDLTIGQFAAPLTTAPADVPGCRIQKMIQKAPDLFIPLSGGNAVCIGSISEINTRLGIKYLI